MIRPWVGACAAVLLAGNARAETVTRHLPLPLHTDAGPVRTSICMEVAERVYPAEAWWKAEARTLDEPQRVLVSVLDGIKRNSEQLLAELPAEDETSTAAAREQREVLLAKSSLAEMIGDVRMYEAGPLMVAFLRLDAESKSGLTSFAFAKQAGRYVSQPAHPRSPAYSLLDAWAYSSWGVLGAGGPGYCTNDELARSNARLSVSSDAGSIQNSASVVFRLIRLEAGSENHAVSASVLTAFARVQDAMRRDRFAELPGLAAPSEAELLRRLDSEPSLAEGRQRLKNQVLDGTPVAVIDGGSLLVLYARAVPSGLANAWYFMANGDAAPRWTRITSRSRIDLVLKSETMLEAMRSDVSLEKLHSAR